MELHTRHQLSRHGGGWGHHTLRRIRACRLAERAALRKVEDTVEGDNLRRVGRRCQAERRHRQQMEEAASHGGSGPGGRDELLRTARAVPMRWCDEKDRLDALRG